MHSLLEKLLKKRGIVSVNDMDLDEKDQFDNWQKTLSGGEMSVEKIKDFCETQLSIIKKQMKDIDNTPGKNERLTMCFNIYSTLVDLISSPQAERETLEKYLTQLLK